MTRRPAKPAAASAASGVIRPPMSLDELDRWLRTPRKLQPVADSLAMLDGFVTAIVAGPVTYEPLGWLCPLLGVTKDAYLQRRHRRSSPRSRRWPNTTTSSPPR